MERFKFLRKIMILLAAILIFELAFMVFLTLPGSFYIWTTIGVIALVCLYIVATAIRAINELMEKESQEQQK